MKRLPPPDGGFTPPPALDEPISGLSSFSFDTWRALSAKAFKGILNGDYDHLPEQAFYMVGTIEEAVEKAKTL